VSVPDEQLDINLDTLKVREIEELEELIGAPLDEAFAEGQPRGKAMRALGYIAKRRVDPEFTWEQAGELVITVKAADPTNGADSPS